MAAGGTVCRSRKAGASWVKEKKKVKVAAKERQKEKATQRSTDFKGNTMVLTMSKICVAENADTNGVNHQNIKKENGGRLVYFDKVQK